MSYSPSYGRFARSPCRRRFRLVSVVLAAGLVLKSGPSGYAQEAPSPANGEAVYRIGPLDTVEIDVFGQPELSRTAIIRPDGRVQLAFGEVLEAAGRTPEGLARAVEAVLVEYIQSPRVEVFVQNAEGAYDQRVRVVGLATQPRAVAYRDGLTALDVVTELGGLQPNADGNDAYLLRRTDGTVERIPLRLDDLTDDGDITANRRLQPGDVLVVPEGFFSGDWEVTTGARFEATYTDNVDLAPDGREDDALILRTGPTASVRGDAARARGGLNVAFLGRTELMSDNSSDPELDVDLSGTGTVEPVRDTVFVDAAASVSRLLVDGGAAQSGAQSNTTNRSTFQTYEVSPYVVNRLGELANMTTRYTATQTLGDGDNLSDSLTHRGNLSLSDGELFGPLGWGADAEASEERRDGASDVSQRSVTATLSYAVTTRLELFARGGYEWFEETAEDGTTVRDRDDPRWSVGFRYQPSPDTRISAEAGQRFGGDTFSLDASHDVSDRTSLFARYNETVSTQQGRFAANLPRRQEDLDGFDARPTRFDINNTVTTTETAEVGATTRLDLNTFRVSAFYTTQTQGIATEGDTEDEVLGVDLGWTRPISPNWRFDSDLAYEQRTTDAGGSDSDDVFASAGVTYRGFKQISIGLTYDFTKRFADRAANEYTENAITLTGRIQF